MLVSVRALPNVQAAGMMTSTGALHDGSAPLETGRQNQPRALGSLEGFSMPQLPQAMPLSLNTGRISPKNATADALAGGGVSMRSPGNYNPITGGTIDYKNLPKSYNNMFGSASQRAPLNGSPGQILY